MIRPTALTASLICCAACCSAQQQNVPLIWLEAEQFSQLGGWANDAQFIDQMGSPYLLANGLGTPVADALTNVRLPAPGKYRLWVRTRDWVPEYHPGTFQVLLDRRPVARTFGQSGHAGWQWEDGGVQELGSQVELRLHDLTGYYGRCDVVVLARDLEWRPAADAAALARLREQHGGVSRAVARPSDYDVVVVGGGLAGCTAAVAAARHGARTVLLQNRPVLGGNASPEILVPPVGVSYGAFRQRYPLDPRETGLVEEYRTAGQQRVAEGKRYAKRLLRFVQAEPNLELFLDTHATGVEMQPGPARQIAAVLAVNTRSGQRTRFAGKHFIDCTGDAVVGVAAGAEYRHGKEPRSLYDEPWAPARPVKETMGNGLKYFPVDAGAPQPFAAPAWCHRFPQCTDFRPGRHPRLPRGAEIEYQWIIELGGQRDTYADAEEIRDDLLRLIYGLWDHTKNHCPQLQEQAARYQLAWVGYVAGKRENRRLIGDYVLTQNDIGNQTLFPDRVAFGAWCVDDHHSAGFFHNGSFGLHMDDPQHAYIGVPYSIPFRCLYSQNVDNLLMAGRNISASHLALADTRVMLTCATLGHAAGTAAALCLERHTTPRSVYREHLRELQQLLLKEGMHILQFRADDPRDLARSATVQASSSRSHTSGESMQPDNVIDGFAFAEGPRDREQTRAWAPQPDAPGPHWIELSWPQPVTFNTVHVVFQTAELAPRSFTVAAWRDGARHLLDEITNNRHRRLVLGHDRIAATKLRVESTEPAGIAEIRLYDEPQRVVDIARRAHQNMRLPDTGPWLPWETGHEAPPLDGIVLEADDAEHAGQWIASTWSPPFLGDGYLHDGDTGKGAKSIRFRPALAVAGPYEVRIAYVACNNRATNTPIAIHATDGVHSVRINQRVKPPIDGLFLSLGTFALDARSTMVVSNDATDGYVVVDAIQLLPKAAPRPR
jgi:hypothetical protein